MCVYPPQIPPLLCTPWHQGPFILAFMSGFSDLCLRPVLHALCGQACVMPLFKASHDSMTQFRILDNTQQ